MSNYEWAVGGVQLPVSEVATIRRNFRRYHNDLIEDAYYALKTFRKTHLTSSKSKWQAAIENTASFSEMNPALYIALKVARSLDKPRAVKWSDFNLPLLQKASVQEDVFPLLSSKGKILGLASFSDRQFEWRVFGGNHSVDFFDDSPYSDFLYNQILKNVSWLRGSGGGETRWSEREGFVVSNRWGSSGRYYKKVFENSNPRHTEDC